MLSIRVEHIAFNTPKQQSWYPERRKCPDLDDVKAIMNTDDYKKTRSGHQ